MTKRFLALSVLAIVAAPAFAQFDLFVAETRPGSHPNPNEWLGVKHYGFSSSGAAAVAKTGLAAGQLSDPAGLIFSGNELFVANRHANVSASSVSRFVFDQGADTLTANGTITGNSLFGAHGIDFRPGTSDVYVSNVNGPASSFSVTAGGFTNNGTLFPGLSMRDVFFSPDGNFAYATVPSNFVRRYAFATGTYTDIAITGASTLHNGSWHNGSFYLASFGNGNIHKINIDALGNLTTTIVANVPDGISVALSPDGQEMYVGRHFGGDIRRLLWDGSTWTDNGSIMVNGVGVGDIAIYSSVPEPFSLAVLAGFAAFTVRRKRR